MSLIIFSRTDKPIEESKMAREKSYAPYSNFKVGTAPLTGDGKIFSGCNIENSSYLPVRPPVRLPVRERAQTGDI